MPTRLRIGALAHLAYALGLISFAGFMWLNTTTSSRASDWPLPEALVLVAFIGPIALVALAVVGATLKWLRSGRRAPALIADLALPALVAFGPYNVLLGGAGPPIGLLILVVGMLCASLVVADQRPRWRKSGRAPTG